MKKKKHSESKDYSLKQIKVYKINRTILIEILKLEDWRTNSW